MKLRMLLVVLALGACKDKKAETTPEAAPPSPCTLTAVHATKLVQSEMGDALAESDWPKVTAALDQRCTEDKWSAEVMACMDAAVTGREFDACADQLTEAQNAAVKEQFEREIVPLMKEDAMKKEEASAPAPASAPPPPAPDDPCGGGE